MKQVELNHSNWEEAEEVMLALPLFVSYFETECESCVLRYACCVLRAACCVLCAVCCMLSAACCVLRAHLNKVGLHFHPTEITLKLVQSVVTYFMIMVYLFLFIYLFIYLFI